MGKCLARMDNDPVVWRAMCGLARGKVRGVGEGCSDMTGMTREEYDREMAVLEDTVWHRYSAKFDQGPPAMHWHGSRAGLESLMQTAIDRGYPLTGADFGYIPDSRVTL
jgi:hypothetical protein